jgi:ferredoxin-NADP reductase/hemoglobin-like flavoprotein
VRRGPDTAENEHGAPGKLTRVSDRAVVTAEETTDKQDAYADFDASADPGAEAEIAADAAQWAKEDLTAEIRESFAVIEPHGAEAAAWFYEHFFAANPRYRKYFSGEAAAQHRRLFQAVQRIVADLDRLDEFLPYLRRLALRHRKFGLRAPHYEAFGASLLATVARYCGPRWTERTNAAWEAGYGLVANVMLEAAAEADAAAPPYWEAEVTAHEPLADGIARIAVRPVEDPRLPGAYEFRAGQYAAVETGALARVWRDFSFANAPGNGEIEFHVQTGRPGGVSEVLVHQTAVGDRLRLAAAEGELAFPAPDRAARLLAVAHGTGAAPVYALVEAAVAEGDQRPITVLLVSEQGPHYLAKAFGALAGAHPDLTVEELGGDPLAAVRAHGAATGPGGTCGAVLVGPGAMVDGCRGALLAAGVDPGDVSSDLFD